MTGQRRGAEISEAAQDFRHVSSPQTRLHLLASLTTHVFDPVTRLVAGRLPGFGLLTHVGRQSRRCYRTPLLVMRRGDEVVIALWYGSDVDWVKNVLAAGRCELETRGCKLRLSDPAISADRARSVLPLPLRWAGALVGLTEFIRLRATG